MHFRKVSISLFHFFSTVLQPMVIIIWYQVYTLTQGMHWLVRWPIDCIYIQTSDSSISCQNYWIIAINWPPYVVFPHMHIVL